MLLSKRRCLCTRQIPLCPFALSSHEHEYRALLVLGRPDREPDFVACLVELGLYHALGTVVGQAGPLGDRQHLVAGFELGGVEHGHADRVLDWPYSSFHRYVERGVYPPDWAAGSAVRGLSFE